MGMRKFTKEERFGFQVSLVLNILFFVGAWFMIAGEKETPRTAFIEVDLGEYADGSPSAQSDVQNDQQATNPDPNDADEQPEEVQDEQPQTETTEDVVKPVDQADQIEDVEDEVVETPETTEEEPETTSDNKEEVVPANTDATEATEQTESTEESGDIEGTGTETEVEEGTGEETTASSPFSLKWDGDIQRATMTQPLPDNTEDIEANITMKFEVRPNGSVGKIIPLKKMNPELEKQIMNVLRKWRFSRLPSSAPQTVQWGTITFRFVLD